MVAGTNPQINAGISPAGQAQAVRVYFKSALGEAFYYVEMAPVAGRYVGVLPKPMAGAGSVTYYVQGTGIDCTQSQTSQMNAMVVAVQDACQGKDMATVGPPDPVRVFSATGETALPAGFTGVSSVVAAAPGPCVPPMTSAAAAEEPRGGGFWLWSTAGIITMAAVAAGVATVVIINDDDNPPASPIR